MLGDLALYADRELFDSSRFADNAASALEDQAVRDAAARRVSRAITREVSPDLVAFEALIEPVTAGVIGSRPFRSALREGLRQAHAIALGEGEQTAAVQVANIGAAAVAALRQLSPKLAKDIPKGLDAKLLSLGDAGFARDLARVANTVSEAAIVLPLAALLLFAAAITFAVDRRAALTRAGVAIALVGALVVLAYFVVGALVARVASTTTDREALGALWEALFGALRDWNLALAAVGAVVAGAGAAVLRPVDAVAPLRRIATAALATPASPLWRAVRGVTFLVAGLVMVLEPTLVLQALTVVAGLVLISIGVGELIRLTIPAAAETETARAHGRRLAAALVIGAGCAAVIVVVAISLIGDDEKTGRAPQARTGTCNGSVELCERRLDQVVFAGAHNAMSAADYPGFLFPMHDRTIRRQLEDGVRALLIDAYYGVPGRRVYTDFSRVPNKLIEQAQEELGPRFVTAANRLRSNIARPEEEAETDLYLCHGFCELGAVDLTKALRQIDSFLEANPEQVVLIVIEDYVKPKDVVAAFERSGLAERAYDGELGEEPPTLGELIESGKQAVVMAENRAGQAPWYFRAFDYFQETPFDFKKPAEMSCDQNRGAPSNPLFQINNWINTDPAAKPSNAAKVNSREFLLKRARKCARQRGLLPNVLAVDFYREGDLFEVTAKLNEDGG